MLRSRRSFLVSSRSPRASWSAAVSLASVVATAPSSGEPVPTGRGGEPVKFRAPFRPPYELVFVHDHSRTAHRACGRGAHGTCHRRRARRVPHHRAPPLAHVRPRDAAYAATARDRARLRGRSTHHAGRVLPPSR